MYLIWEGDETRQDLYDTEGKNRKIIITTTAFPHTSDFLCLFI